MTRVAVSILNYNSSRSTIACVHSLLCALEQSGETYSLEIFVIDNSSTAEEQRQLQRSLIDFPEIHLQINSVNRGFAAGHNENLEKIFVHSSPDYIWILNNDCLVYEDTLSSMVKCSQQHPDIGIWGATLLEQDGETVQCAGGCFYNAWISTYSQYGRGKPHTQIDQLKSVGFDYIAGASLFFPVKTLREGLRSVTGVSAGKDTENGPWLNESFFLYFEELDLAQRLKPGFGLAWCRDALIKHSGGTSTGTVGSQRTQLAEYHSTLSALRYTRLYHPRRLWFMAPARYLAKCFQLLLKGEFRLLGPLTRAYRDFMPGN